MKKLTVTFTGDALKVWEACVKAKAEVSSWPVWKRSNP